MKKYLLSLLVITLISTILQAATPYDFDGDAKSDFAVTQVVHPNVPADLTGFFYWYVSRSSDNSLLFQHWGARVIGISDDIPRPADYDGDGRTDFAIQRHFENQLLTDFYILNSSDNTIRVETFGRKTDNTLVIGDYDGDGKADLAAFGKFVKGYGFYYKGSLNNPNGTQTGVFTGYSVGTPYPGDFDGDGKFDFCVKYNVTGQPNRFSLKRSSDGISENINWGIATDELATGDFDGDGRNDFCVRRPNGPAYNWYILERDGGGTGTNPIVWGTTQAGIGRLPFGGADFDGDGKTDIGFYNTSTSVFSIRKSSNGGLISHQMAVATPASPIYNLF
jgi:FG-GAP-like repeat